MQKNSSCPRGWNVASVTLIAVLGFGSLASAADETVTGNLTIQSNAPKLIFDDNDSSQLWRIRPDAVSFDIFNETANTVPFEILPGAPDASFHMAADGRIGLGTDFPDPDAALHIATPLDQAILRLESARDTASYAWELRAYNGAFGLGDVNSGTTPLQVGAGAPDNTLFISGLGNVGIGGAFPLDANSQLHIRSSLLNGLLMKRATADPHYLRIENSGSVFRCGVQGNGDTQFGALTPGKGLALVAGGTGKLSINAAGQISFGSTPPTITTHALVHTSGARLTAGGIWTDASSRSFKQDIEPITSDEARDTVRALQPVGYRYKSELDERYVGFIAEDVPELVATRDRKALAPMDIVGVLTKVVQDQDQMNDKQQTTIDQQQCVIAEQQQMLVALSRRLAVLEMKQPEPREPLTIRSESK